MGKRSVSKCRFSDLTCCYNHIWHSHQTYTLFYTSSTNHDPHPHHPCGRTSTTTPTQSRYRTNTHRRSTAFFCFANTFCVSRATTRQDRQARITLQEGHPPLSKSTKTLQQGRHLAGRRPQGTPRTCSTVQVELEQIKNQWRRERRRGVALKWSKLPEKKTRRGSETSESTMEVDDLLVAPQTTTSNYEEFSNPCDDGKAKRPN